MDTTKKKGQWERETTRLRAKKASESPALTSKKHKHKLEDTDMEKPTGAFKLKTLEPDDTTQDTNIPDQFLLAQTHDWAGSARVTPACTPLTVPPSPVQIMSEDGCAAVGNLEKERKKVSRVTNLF